MRRACKQNNKRHRWRWRWQWRWQARSQHDMGLETKEGLNGTGQSITAPPSAKRASKQAQHSAARALRPHPRLRRAAVNKEETEETEETEAGTAHVRAGAQRVAFEERPKDRSRSPGCRRGPYPARRTRRAYHCAASRRMLLMRLLSTCAGGAGTGGGRRRGGTGGSE